MTRWPTKPLLEICSPKQWPTISKSEMTESGYPVFGANGQIGYYHSYNHEEPAILITCRGATCGTLNISPARAYVTGNAMALDNLRLDLINSKYLYYALLGRGLKDTVTGAAQPQITYANLSRVSIPFPPLAKQEQIVKLLDEADELRKLRAQADRRTADLIPALFNEMFGDLPKDSGSWSEVPLGEIVDLGSGATPSKGKLEYWDGKTPWVSPKDMKPDEIFDTEDHVSEVAFAKTNLTRFPKDTVLIVVRGMILAHTVPIRLCRVGVAINQDMKALLPRRPIEPEFLRWALQTQHSDILNQVSTASHGTKKLDSERLKTIRVPTPPLPLQKEFVARVSEIRELKADQGASRQRLDDLFQSMLHRAFAGEL